MKQYRVLMCSVTELENKLNKFSKEGWTLIHAASPVKASMTIILEKSEKSEEDNTRINSQQESGLFQLMSNIIKSQHDVIKSIVQNMKS